ncbi:hypothetical protein H2248_008458 [Termitomyces sp. 'cryptogamus']|nr:hypothetical protein H2248_008458 [Termitomyces sp. 'cryptogamus']
MGVEADWVVSGTVAEGDVKMDKALVAYVYASIELEQCYCIKGMKSAAAAWAALKQAYQKSTMGHCIHAHNNIDAIKHDTSHPIEIYIQAVTAAFQELINLDEKVSGTAFDNQLLCHLDPSYSTICTSILAQKKEPDLAKIKSTLIGSASSEYTTVKSETGLSAHLEKNKGKGKSQLEPVTNGFKEGKYTWYEKGNGDSYHHCGCDRHISCLCACDMPTAIKDLVLQGAKDHAHAKACHAYANLDEQDANNDDGLQVVHTHTGQAPYII